MATEVNSFFWPGPDLGANARRTIRVWRTPGHRVRSADSEILAAGRNVADVSRSE